MTAPALPRIVLVVDDHDEARKTLAEFLSLSGFQVVTAKNGSEACEVARRAQPQAIVMDLSMPVLDGWEATRRLKDDPVTQAIPVIALTAFGHSEAHQRALAAGVEEVVVKPCDPRALEQRLRHYVGRSDAAEAAAD